MRGAMGILGINGKLLKNESFKIIIPIHCNFNCALRNILHPIGRSDVPSGSWDLYLNLGKYLHIFG